MTLTQRTYKTLAVLVACAHLGACSTLRSSDMADTGPSGLKSNDQVVLTLRSGAQASLTLTAVAPEWLEGRENGSAQSSAQLTRGNRSDIASVQRVELDSSKTWSVVGAMLAAVVDIGVSAARSFGKSINSSASSGR